VATTSRNLSCAVANASPGIQIDACQLITIKIRVNGVLSADMSAGACVTIYGRRR
jgi:hypothetical protein